MDYFICLRLLDITVGGSQMAMFNTRLKLALIFVALDSLNSVYSPPSSVSTIALFLFILFA